MRPCSMRWPCMGQDTPELREQLQGAIQDGMPSEGAPGRAA